MLSQIVGLEAYEKLHEKADSERKSFEGAAKNLDVQLASLAIVDEVQIKEANDQATEWETQAKAAHDKHLQWTQLLVRAERWQELREEQATIENLLRDAQVLFSQAEKIEANAARWHDLKGALPRLREVKNESERLSSCEEIIARANDLAQKAQTAFEAAKQRLQEAQKTLNDLQEQQKAAQIKRDEARDQEAELGAHLPALDELENARRELQSLDAELSRFADDLDSRLTVAKAAAEHGQTIKNALPWLKQFASSRAAFNALKTEAKQTEGELKIKREEFEKATARLSQIEVRESQVRKDVLVAQERATEMQTLREQIRKRVERLKSQENLAECEYCGQPLTPRTYRNRKRPHSRRICTRRRGSTKRRDATR